MWKYLVSLKHYKYGTKCALSEFYLVLQVKKNIFLRQEVHYMQKLQR